MARKHEEKVPEIEPPCTDCVKARFASGRGDAMCARHAERHIHGHGYRYHREIPLRTHDSNVIPTGVEFRR